MQALRKVKIKNNNLKRKRLIINSTNESLLKMKVKNLRIQDKRMKRKALIFFFIGISAITFNVFSTKSKLNSAKIEYNNLDSQYMSYDLTRTRLKTELEDSIDLQEIQRYAREELGMVSRNSKNTVYVNVNR